MVPVGISQVKLFDADGVELRTWDEYALTHYIDLTNDGSILGKAESISHFRLSTNSERISVVVSGDIESENASIALFDAEASAEIMVLQIRPGKRSGEFTNVTQLYR